MQSLDFVMDGCTLKYYQGDGGGVAVPAHVRKIGKNAFYGCDGATRVSLPEGLVRIGGGVFRWCNAMNRVTLPDGTVRISPQRLKCWRKHNRAWFDSFMKRW